MFLPTNTFAVQWRKTLLFALYHNRMDTAFTSYTKAVAEFHLRSQHQESQTDDWCRTRSDEVTH